MKSYVQLFATFFKIGLFTIGGGLAMLPLIQRIIVQDKKWMTEEDMVDCVAVCQSLPGVIAINAATYVGQARKGVRGAIAASVGVVLPSFIIIILAVLFLQFIGDDARIQGVFESMKAVSCALILCAAITIGKRTLRSVFAWSVAVVGFGMIVFVGLSAIFAILLGVSAGFAQMAYQMIALARKRKKEAEK